MTSYTHWALGDLVRFVALESLLAVTLIGCLALLLDRILVMRQPVLSRNLWLAAVVAIFLTPFIVVFGPKVKLPLGMPDAWSSVAHAPAQSKEAAPPVLTPVTRVAQPESSSKVVCEDAATQETTETESPRFSHPL